MSYRHFPVSEFTRMPWKNGGGVTHEIFRFPDASDEWQWRVSIAEVASDGAFSLFPGCMRSLTLLSGEGMRLDFSEHSVELLPPYASVQFSGDEMLSAHLLDGPTTDFNAIWQADRFDVRVERRAMHGSLWCIAEPNTSWLVYFLSGYGRIKSDVDSPEIQAGDALWLQPNDSQQRLILEAFGEALWLKIIEH
jgi:environmental stress-induced protein Ves